ncbi:MAG TPA: MBL fold metallo-hydrolase [Candidatus Cloacimonadota bacterium]|nr:MBL fold metallo-hydrolase [Candidatus Cloacimonadota bacterium]HPT72694.1 MBL fold metallo-hydrolase [Candidatus Cloacimonadota bacterium]
MKYEVHILLGGYETNTYLCWDESSHEALLIDPAAPSIPLWNRIVEKGLKIKYIINTHGHADHIGGNDFFKEKSKAPIAIHLLDAEHLNNSTKNLSTMAGMKLTSPQADIILADGDILKIGESEMKVIHTPGHTEGGICIYGDGLLFSGDTLFQEDVGRTDLPGGNNLKLQHSIQQILFELPDETIVLPGHGPATTIGEEKIGNIAFGLISRL